MMTAPPSKTSAQIKDSELKRTSDSRRKTTPQGTGSSIIRGVHNPDSDESQMGARMTADSTRHCTGSSDIRQGLLIPDSAQKMAMTQQMGAALMSAGIRNDTGLTNPMEMCSRNGGSDQQ